MFVLARSNTSLFDRLLMSNCGDVTSSYCDGFICFQIVLMLIQQLQLIQRFLRGTAWFRTCMEG
jgi:hypothetical protein